MKRSSLIAIVVFLALLVGALVLVTQRPERGISRISYAELKKDSVDHLVFAGKNPAELSKADGQWKLANGRLADQAAVGRLLDGLLRLKSSDLLTRDPARFAEYDLDDAKGTRLTVYAGKQELADLVIGKGLPGAVAVRVGGRAFRVMGSSPITFVRGPGGWIEKKLFDEKPDEASRVEVKLAGVPPYTLVKSGTTWSLEGPVTTPQGFRFDADAARTLASAVAALRAKDFEEEDPGVEVTGLGDGADSIAVTFTPAAPAPAADAKEASAAPAPAPVTRVVRLGKTKAGGKDLYARIEGRSDLFTVYEGTARALQKKLADLRDLKPMSFDVAKAQRLSVSDGKVALVFARKDGVWQLVSSAEPRPEGFELDPAAVDRRLSAVASTRATRLAEAKDGASGLEGAASRVVVSLEGGATATLAFGREIKDGTTELVFARGNADGATYLLTKWARQSLLGGLASFKKQASPPGGMPSIDPASLSNLPPDVRESLLRQMSERAQQQKMMQKLGVPPGGAPAAAPAPAPGPRK